MVWISINQHVSSTNLALWSDFLIFSHIFVEIGFCFWQQLLNVNQQLFDPFNMNRIGIRLVLSIHAKFTAAKNRDRHSKEGTRTFDMNVRVNPFSLRYQNFNSSLHNIYYAKYRWDDCGCRNLMTVLKFCNLLMIHFAFFGDFPWVDFDLSAIGQLLQSQIIS